jgi:hypothetical protein
MRLSTTSLCRIGKDETVRQPDFLTRIGIRGVIDAVYLW